MVLPFLLSIAFDNQHCSYYVMGVEIVGALRKRLESAEVRIY